MKTINIDQIGSDFDKHQYINQCIKDNQVDIQFGYAADFKNAKILRDFMEVIFTLFDFPKREMARFILASDEMNNNAIEYGSSENEMNYLRIKVNKQNTIISLSMEVEDTWNGKFAKTAEEMEEFKKVRIHENYKEHKSIRWRGLFLIIINIVDELYFKNTDSGWLIVWFKKDLLI
jgi:anti-sigma regulatory factor (Ser/Thr protein kinase)